MSAPDTSALEREWVVLQGNVEQHERNALAIKLAAVLVFTAAMVFSLSEAVIAWLVVILWVQEAMVRTFQSRIGARILRVEEMLRGVAGQALQLHSEWQASRGALTGMLIEYATSASRPTVAFPYVALLLVDFLLPGTSAGIDVPPT
jgi:hypothetical protein